MSSSSSRALWLLAGCMLAPASIAAGPKADTSAALFQQMDTDRDGRVSRKEHAAGHARMLQRPAG